MIIKRDELKKALEIVKPGLASKDVIEQATSFAFIDGRVVTFNDEISISHPIPGSELTGALKADELYKLLNKIKKDELNMEITDTEVQITAGKAKAGITLQTEIRLPLEEISQIGKWHPVPTNLLAAIQFCLFSCSHDISQPTLTCVHLDFKNAFVESCDNYRITRMNLTNKLNLPDILIPHHCAREIVKYGVTQISKGEATGGWFHFKTGEETIISTRIYEDRYTDLNKYLDVTGQEITYPMTFSQILDRASIFTSGEPGGEVVTITLSAKQIEVSAQNSAGWFKETANLNYNGEIVSFITNPRLLKDILATTASCIIGTNRLKFNGADWTHIVSLVVPKVKK